MSHPAAEQNIFLCDRLLNSLSMTRAIGDFSFKFHPSFLTQLFSYLPSTFSDRYIPGIAKYSKTPPYVIARPGLRYINLQSFRDRNPILILFTDGVNNLVSGAFDFNATPRKEDPSAVVGALLGDKVSSSVESILGHGVESKWHGCDGNRAIEILGNLLGGTDIERLSMKMDPTIISDADDAEFYIDDTSIIICDIFHSTISS
jgi:pyruvate dehydrogenase phosphatase